MRTLDEIIDKLTTISIRLRPLFPDSPGQLTGTWESGLSRLQCAVGQRALWWPNGLPPRPFVAPVSSRIGRVPERNLDWFQSLWAAIHRAANAGAAVLIVPTTSVAPFANRAAEQAGVSRVVVHCPPPRQLSIDAWVRSVERALLDIPTDTTTVWHGWLSPLMPRELLPDFEQQRPTALGPLWNEDLPVADRTAFGLADELDILALRKGGSIDRLLQTVMHDLSLQHPVIRFSRPITNNRISAVPDSPHLAETFRSGVGELTRSGRRSGGRAQQPQDQKSPNITYSDCLALGDIYLTHCTRRRFGPWPGQCEQEYIDDLLLGRPAADHSPLAALRRILHERRIRAVATMNRDKTAVVSFTEIPIVELLQYRTFRAHRGGWDFEPYGVAFRRERLSAFGARAVIYGDERLWQSLDADSRPFFQPRYSRVSSGNPIDWQVEREWRHVGDVELDSFAADDLIVLVASNEEASKIRSQIPWPIYVAGTD